MSESDKYYIVSQDGFGGPLFRMAERYINKGGETKISVNNYQTDDNTRLSLVIKESPSGKFYRISARSSKRVEVGIVQPLNDSDFTSFVDSRNPRSGKVNPTEIPTISDPIEFTLSVLARLICEEEMTSPISSFSKIIDRESIFPPQNPEEIFRRFRLRQDSNSEFRFACFVCLDTKCQASKGMPVYYLGQDEKRLTIPRFTRRTQEILSSLENSQIPFSIDVLIADTDIYELYQEWLADPDQSTDILKYQQKLTEFFARVSPRCNVRLWSEIQSKYSTSYQKDFKEACDKLDEYQVMLSSARRIEFFQKKGIPINEETKNICRLTAARNFAIYAAQGPIINSEYDCLIMADPDPLRLGEKQSLLCPKLPIWYPYSG